MFLPRHLILFNSEFFEFPVKTNVGKYLSFSFQKAHLLDLNSLNQRKKGQVFACMSGSREKHIFHQAGHLKETLHIL